MGIDITPHYEDVCIGPENGTRTNVSMRNIGCICARAIQFALAVPTIIAVTRQIRWNAVNPSRIFPVDAR